MLSAAGPEFLCPREEVYRGSGTISAKVFCLLALHEALHFLAGAEMLVPKR